MFLSELCFGLAGLTGVIGASVISHKFVEMKKISDNKKASMKNLQKIAENDPSLSKNDRVKIVKKYAKANLKLCKLLGCPLCGKFHMVSGMSTDKKTEALNAIDSLELLKALETTDAGKAKWDKKIKDKRKITGTYSQNGAKVWTKKYDEFIDGISIYDRRTEIVCLTDKTTREFEQMASDVTTTDEIGASVTLTFKSTSRIQTTYARIADPEKQYEIKNLMLKDVYYACEGKTQQEIDAMFPIRVNSIAIDKKNANDKDKSQKFINSYSQLKTEALRFHHPSAMSINELSLLY